MGRCVLFVEALPEATPCGGCLRSLAADTFSSFGHVFERSFRVVAGPEVREVVRQMFNHAAFHDESLHWSPEIAINFASLTFVWLEVCKGLF